MDFNRSDRVHPSMCVADIHEMSRLLFAQEFGDTTARSAMDEELRPLLRIFSVVEKMNTRRRIIAWPRSVNEAAREEMANFTGEWPYFPTATDCVMPVKRKYARTADLKKFYQQFELRNKQDYCFQAGTKIYALSTVPTGHVFPPYFAQTILSSLRRAILSRWQNVDVTMWLDNIRVAADDEIVLDLVWQYMLAVFDDLGITLGESTAITQRYDFLGVTYDHTQASVAMAEKTVNKLRFIANFMLRHDEPIDQGTCQKMFGICAQAAALLGQQLAPYYYIFKYMRRVAKDSPGDKRTIWPSIRSLWSQWALALAGTTRFVNTDDKRQQLTLFTDASSHGFGAVLLGSGTTFSVGKEWDEEQLATISGRFTQAEANLHINAKELLALKKALLLIPRHMLLNVDLHLRIDNTSALAWIKKRRSRSFLPNSIVGDIAAIRELLGIEFTSVEYVSTDSNIADEASRSMFSETTRKLVSSTS